MVNIHKGKHRGTPWKIKLIRGSCVTKIFTFKESCLYDLPVSEVNKLFGYSYDLLNKDTVRFGWKAVRDRIQLWAYFHKDFKKYDNLQTVLTVVSINKPVKLSLYTIDDITYFSIDDKVYHSSKFKKKYWGWNQNVYFGGQTPAPHDMEIEINENSNKC